MINIYALRVITGANFDELRRFVILIDAINDIAVTCASLRG